MPSRNEENDELLSLLRDVFGKDNVKHNWDVAKDAEDAYTRELYVPRIDYAIGPFNLSNDPKQIDRDLRCINKSYYNHKNLFNSLIGCAEYPENFSHNFEFNDNPRCFVAIEVENRTSRKHRLGSMINASAMGKVAIMVAKTPAVMTSFEKLLKYLMYLRDVKSLKFLPWNLILIEIEDFKKLLSEYAESR